MASRSVKLMTEPRPRNASASLKRPFVDVRAHICGLLIWLTSGDPIITSSPYYETLLIALVVAVMLLSSHRPIDVIRIRPLLYILAGLAVWCWLAKLLGVSGQIFAFVGHALKVAILALLVATQESARRILIDSLYLIAIVSICIFVTRQLLIITTGFDLADLFSGLYPLTGVLPDRTIVIYNFDIPEEATRNSGPFREPGLFAANLVMGILLLLSGSSEYTRRTFFRRIVVLGLALLSTQSTMGLAAVPGLLLLALLQLGRTSFQKVLLVPLLLLVAVSMWYVVTDFHGEKIAYQLELAETESNTWYQSRFGNTLVDLEAIKLRPWTGYGFAETGRPRFWEGYDDPGFGNGLTGTIVKFGIPFAGFLYFYLLVRLRCLYNSWFSAIVATTVLAVTLFSQQLLTMPVVYVFFAELRRQGRRRD